MSHNNSPLYRDHDDDTTNNNKKRSLFTFNLKHTIVQYHFPHLIWFIHSIALPANNAIFNNSTS